MKTAKEVRNSFWQYLNEFSPELAKLKRSRKSQNDYCTDIRVLFVDYVDGLAKNNIINESLAKRVTL